VVFVVNLRRLGFTTGVRHEHVRRISSASSSDLDLYEQADADPLGKLGRHLILVYRDLRAIQELVRLRAIAGIFLSTRKARGKGVAVVGQEIRSLQNQRREQGLPLLWVASSYGTSMEGPCVGAE
jgi:hypothetical protein